MYFGLGFMFVRLITFWYKYDEPIMVFLCILHGAWIVIGVGTNIVVHDNVHDFSYLTICFMIHP